MKYIIGEKRDDRILIDTVTEDPKGYALEFEPIDIINGQQYAWNDNGERFVFLTGTDYDSKNENKGLFSIVNVGSWSADGPILKSNGQDSLELLASSLSDYIAANGKHIGDTQNMSFAALMNIAAKDN